MKPMKHVSISLALCAIPAMAVGQVTTTCTGCTHALSHYMGSGGFIATATEGAKKVTWLGQCGGIVRTGELVPNADGIVSALLSEENGLACMAEKASFELGPIMDGGWFWITDEKNSAVGLLVDKEVHKALKDDAVKIASAGEGVKMTAGVGAVYLKETSTGRVGILPNILPKPVMPLRKCGFTGSGTSAKRLNTSCQLGDGSAMIVATISDPLTGTLRRIPNNGTVVRPGGTGTLAITFDAWMAGGGHFPTDAASDARLGHPEFVETSDRSDLRLDSATYTAMFGKPLTFERDAWDTGSFTSHGIKLTTEGSALTMEIQAKDTHCSKTNNFSLPVRVMTWLAKGSVTDQVTPSVKSRPHDYRTRRGTKFVSTLGGEFDFTIVCPSGSGAG